MNEHGSNSAALIAEALMKLFVSAAIAGGSEIGRAVGSVPMMLDVPAVTAAVAAGRTEHAASHAA